MVLPVDRCGPEDKVEQGTVKDLFDLVPLPSLWNEGGFSWLRPCRRRCMGCECPRGAGEANERPLEHGEQKGQAPGRIRNSVICLVSTWANKNPVLSIPIGGLCIKLQKKCVSTQKSKLAAEKKTPPRVLKTTRGPIYFVEKHMRTTFGLEGVNGLSAICPKVYRSAFGGAAMSIHHLCGL